MGGGQYRPCLCFDFLIGQKLLFCVAWPILTRYLAGRISSIPIFDIRSTYLPGVMNGAWYLVNSLAYIISCTLDIRQNVNVRSTYLPGVMVGGWVMVRGWVMRAMVLTSTIRRSHFDIRPVFWPLQKNISMPYLWLILGTRKKQFQRPGYGIWIKLTGIPNTTLKSNVLWPH